MLSGMKIKEEYKNGNIYIEEFSDDRLNPNSYNLRLHNELKTYKNIYKDDPIDMNAENETEVLLIPKKGLILKPGKLYLGRTKEYTKTDGFVPGIEGRSSVARLGIQIHVTAGFGDNGFQGYWTLEISCIEPVKIYPGKEICQIYYDELIGNDHLKYNGKYQNNGGIESSKMYLDKNEKENDEILGFLDK